MKMNNLVKIITLVVVIAMVAAMALVSCKKDEPVDNTTNEQIEALNATIADLKAALDKAQADASADNAELEAALKDAIASLEQAGIDSEKWNEATANVTAAIDALYEASDVIADAYGFIDLDEDGKYADVWYVMADLAAAEEKAWSVAYEAIIRAITVEEQNAAIEAYKAALAPENFEKIDARIANLIAAIEADEVTYPADKDNVKTLMAIVGTVGDYCAEAEKAIADAELVEKAEKVYAAYTAVAEKTVGQELKDAMDAFVAKDTTMALVDEYEAIMELAYEWEEFVLANGSTVQEAIAGIKKFDKTIEKFGNKEDELDELVWFYDYVTSVYDEEEGTVDGFNAEMANVLKNFDKMTLVEIAAAIEAFNDEIDYYVDVDPVLSDLLEIEENYNIFNHETLAKLEAAFAEATAAIVEKAEAFIKAVEALEDLETVDLAIATLVSDAKTAWNALESDYEVATQLNLFVDEDGDNLYDYTIEEYKDIYEANKAMFNAIQELVNTINTNVTNANKLVYVNYQYDKKDDKGNLVDSKYYSINDVDYATFTKVFSGEASYQNVDGKLAGYIAVIDAAVEKLTLPTAKQVEDGADGSKGTGLYGLKLADEVVAQIAAVKLTAAKVDALAEVLEFDSTEDAFDGKTALRAEIVNDIWSATTEDAVALQLANYATEYANAKAAVEK